MTTMIDWTGIITETVTNTAEMVVILAVTEETVVLIDAQIVWIETENVIEETEIERKGSVIYYNVIDVFKTI